jgi:hypothetical protein
MSIWDLQIGQMVMATWDFSGIGIVLLHFYEGVKVEPLSVTGAAMDETGYVLVIGFRDLRLIRVELIRIAVRAMVGMVSVRELHGWGYRKHCFCLLRVRPLPFPNPRLTRLE